MDSISRINEIGMPRRNNELWTFFPVHKIPALVFQGQASGNEFSEQIAKELDIAALLPFAFGAKTFKKNVAQNSNETSLIKCNDDFGHTVLNVESGAKVSLEILDNKVFHEISAERFDINVGENAEVEIFFANPSNDLPLKFRHFRISQKANSTVRFLEIEQGTGINRISIDAFLKEKGAHFEVRVLNSLKQNSSVHHRLSIHHEAEETTSIQFARNLLNDSANASYDGKVIVNENCNKVFSSQLINTILLSENSSVSVKPILKIYHDDVECTHGNTCGQLNPEQLFYLTSRGIPENKAKEMLIKSFAKELFSPLPQSCAKQRLYQVLENL